RPTGNLGPRVEAQLIQDVPDMRFNGALGDHQLGAYLLTREPLRDKSSYFLFAPRQARGRPSARRRRWFRWHLLIQDEGHAVIDRHRQSALVDGSIRFLT